MNVTSPTGKTPPRDGSRPPRRLIARYLAVALACLACWVFLLVSLVALPRVDEPQQADAVVVLGPARPQRVDTAVALVEAGYAQMLVVSVARSGGYTPDRVDVCSTQQPFEVLCLPPDPNTTQGEARYIAALAAQHGWSSVILVSMHTHANRARMYVARCVDLDIAIVLEQNRPMTPQRWARELVYETGAWGKAAATFSC
ncbi:hypothetical protein GCM10011490_22760 [Pseudoclavibacter endophyticus]|uniref:YdcF family protein n=1 Tax=Pseudoclavibacter endophyticus TaxID=1778590 RepID=A0A6H9WQI5_9MICO|nr:YdcF family protein [Pseudoclavibacter endophyticus]KAB1648305.1 YdcF family protein [Pseudoclavibacter endophyticus]GGA71503.1 hypothetical protein GCM10011490_22760 [Pseudoclavibacter endophyticus]